VSATSGDDQDGPGSGPNSFSCNPADSAQTPSAIKRLPRAYFENSVAELLSPLDESTRTALIASLTARLDLIPADSDEHFTTNDASLSQDHVDAIFGVAISLAAKVSEDPIVDAGLVSVCGAGTDVSALADDECLTTVVSYYGRKALRRPLSQAEIDDFKSFYAQAVAADVDGLSMLIGRLVAHPSPHCRFDSEGDRSDGTEGVDATYELTEWELLSKVTFLFWAAPPTDELLDRVEATDITKDAELAALIGDVLESPKTEQGVLRFDREWLHLEKAKTPGTEGDVVAGAAMLARAGVDTLPASHREDMIQEVLDLTRHYTLSTDGGLADILTSPYSFAKSDALASIYGVAPWSGDASQLVTLPEGERSGLLTRAAFVTSGAEYTRPIIKGEMIRTRLLCEPVSPPPPELNIVPLTHPDDKTTREATEEQLVHGLGTGAAQREPGFMACLVPRRLLQRHRRNRGRGRVHQPRRSESGRDEGDVSRSGGEARCARPTRQLLDCLRSGAQQAGPRIVERAGHHVRLGGGQPQDRPIHRLPQRRGA